VTGARIETKEAKHPEEELEERSETEEWEELLRANRPN
jgi:hypothetical protein